MRIGVIQPLPGIGDMIWFLPALRALAAAAPNGKITLFTRANALPHQLFSAEPMIETIGILPSKKRGFIHALPHFFRTWQAVRKNRVDRLYILHQSGRYRTAARLAGVREIIAYPPALAKSKENGWAKSLSFLRQQGIPIAEIHSRLAVDPKRIEEARSRFADRPKPWTIVAPGASTAERLWPEERFAACADALAAKYGGTIFVLGSPKEADRVACVHALSHAASIVPVADMAFDQVMGLLAESLFLLGNDSGPANVMAALGHRSFALCGTSVPPVHSPHQCLITPEVAPNMAAISIEQVLNRIYADVLTVDAGTPLATATSASRSSLS